MLVNHLRMRSLLGSLFLTVLLLTVFLPVSAQNTASKGVQVKGRITGPDGQPVVGAVVQNLTEKTFTSTDSDGNYSLFVKDPQKATMEVTFLGMDTITEQLAGRSQFDVTLSDSQNCLEGSVVTGYQEIQLRKVTGAISTVGAKTIEERYSPSLLQNLEGRVAGLSTYGGKLTIRGISSMYAESSPLLVVDGLPIEGDIDDLNPYDIESVNVLKDAAAAAEEAARRAWHRDAGTAGEGGTGLLRLLFHQQRRRGGRSFLFHGQRPCQQRQPLLSHPLRILYAGEGRIHPEPGG